MAENYQLCLNQILAEIDADALPTLLLHACCAPCSSYVLEYLNRYFQITLFFYNPNIFPKAEYLHRKEELERLIREMPLEHSVKIIDGDYCPEQFFTLAKGLEHLPEREERCQKCIRHRLEKTFQLAKTLEHTPDFVGTTLSISPQKDAAFINEAGAALSKKYNVPWLYSDFLKKGGYKHSIVLSREYRLFRHAFCGCVYSKENQKNQK